MLSFGPCPINQVWLIFVFQNLKYSNCFYRILSCVQAHLSSIWILITWMRLMESTNVALAFLVVSMRLLWVVLDFCLTFVFPTLWRNWIEALFAAGCVFLSIVSYVFVSITSCVLFVIRHHKGICPAILGMCNGRVVRSAIGFDVGGPPSTIGFGNVGWTIRLCQAPTIIVVLSLVGGEAKLISELCPTMWRLDGITQLFPYSNVST
jgi:uncharacterized protein YjeT (DUF2065 family)